MHGTLTAQWYGVFRTFAFSLLSRHRTNMSFAALDNGCMLAVYHRIWLCASCDELLALDMIRSHLIGDQTGMAGTHVRPVFCCCSQQCSVLEESVS